MAAITTNPTRIDRKPARKQRRSQTSVGTAPRIWAPAFLGGDRGKYVALVLKCLVATAVVFGAVSALTSTKERHATLYRPAEKQKRVAGHKTAESGIALTENKAPIKHRAALVSGNNAAIREAPRANAKILDRAVFGSSVDVIGEDGRWAQVHAVGQNVSGWIEKGSLNF
ncbi:SH3 domain-containing protein [Methylocystis sp. WRRC1]|uniref:SH3 domain-containing protein n=1 Tax=Methylocystis sp. WRRC1 TaxID=1732014 RepID=UPI001D144DCD|nr:SH3 domain-containing protein [Methylocystis sp. WRRC1]MCC3246474.1 SH3 domain-containing protein [Methylocystis sp. WRRC1]